MARKNSNMKDFQNMLERMDNPDKDFRFMATNDLLAELQGDTLSLEDELEESLTRKIIHLLTDKNCEVQNLSVKCLKHLISKIKIERLEMVIIDLCSMMISQSEQIRDISLIALKAIVGFLPINDDVVKIITVHLLPNLQFSINQLSDINIKLECLDVLTELINLVASSIGDHHKTIKTVLLDQLSSLRSAVRKRSITALSQLMICCSQDLFVETLEQILVVIKNICETEKNNLIKEPASEVSTHAKTILQCLGSILRVAGHRCEKIQIESAISISMSLSEIDDDELREHCIQVFEAILKRASALSIEYHNSIMNVCLQTLTHDPNYNYDEDEFENEEMQLDGSDQESESSDDYTDDDDISWKVRRASAKCLETLIIVRSDLVVDFYDTIAPVLISRFKEREENVKVEIIQAFITLIKQSSQKSDGLSNTNTDSPALTKLTHLVPMIVERHSKLLREKSLKTRQIMLSLFTEIMRAIPNSYHNHIEHLISGVLYSLTDRNSTSSIKIGVLTFIKEIITRHDQDILQPHLHSIIPAVTNTIGDFYKIASEALTLLSRIIKLLRPDPLSQSQSIQQSIKMVEVIYDRTIQCLCKKDMDLEIKERSMVCLSQIIATFGDNMQSVLPEALTLLVQKLDDETTRLTAVKSLITITSSPINIDLSLVYPRAYANLSSFLRKNLRPLRINTLILIESSVKKAPHLITQSDIESILVQTCYLINENDLYISQLALNMVAVIIENHPAYSQSHMGTVLAHSLQLLLSPLLQGSALQSMLDFLTTLIREKDFQLDHTSLLKELLKPMLSEQQIHKHAFASTSKAIAVICSHDVDISQRTVQQFLSDLKLYRDNDSIQILLLLSIGEIGKRVDLSSVDNIIHDLLEAFSSTWEDVKTAGSYALGCIAIGNIDRFLPFILNEIEVVDKKRYLLLHSLREIIAAKTVSSTLMNKHLENVWKVLMRHCDCFEEGTKNVVSECLGTLILLRPDELLPKILANLTQDSGLKPTARGTLIMAIKYTIIDKPHRIDDLLALSIEKFFCALEDEDINVRRVALITFNTAAHNKPRLIRNLLPKILPKIYEETKVKQHLIRLVQMGPFKHEVDDGLESRKTAFECMYTLLDSCKGRLDVNEFLSYVEQGMKDHNDIKMLTYLMLTKLSSLYPSAILARIDKLLTPIEAVCRSNVKDNAVKQEKERLDELKRSALRAFDPLLSLPEANRHPVILRFKHFIASDKELLRIYTSVFNDNTQSSGDTTSKMDLS